MIVEFVLTNSTLNYLKRNCHMNALQIINKYDNVSDVIQYLLQTGMKWISKTENKIKCKIILLTRVRSWFYD